jgi:hypothetical protein
MFLGKYRDDSPPKTIYFQKNGSETAVLMTGLKNYLLIFLPNNALNIFNICIFAPVFFRFCEKKMFDIKKML